MKYKLGLTLAVASVAGFAFVGPGQADPEFKNKYESVGDSEDCGHGNVIDYIGPLKMWPPNHKLQDVAVAATDGPSTSDPLDSVSDATTVKVTVNLLDAVGGDGGPQHDPDVFPLVMTQQSGDPTARQDFQLRSERSGRGEGRAYNIHVDATFDNGRNSCGWDFAVTVPHDMRGGADWK